MAFNEAVEKFFSNISRPDGGEEKTEGQNRPWTPEEWFARAYTGQERADFPKHVFENISEDKIQELIKQHDALAAAKKHEEQVRLDNGKQLDLFE